MSGNVIDPVGRSQALEATFYILSDAIGDELLCVIEEGVECDVTNREGCIGYGRGSLVVHLNGDGGRGDVDAKLGLIRLRSEGERKRVRTQNLELGGGNERKGAA